MARFELLELSFGEFKWRFGLLEMSFGEFKWRALSISKGHLALTGTTAIARGSVNISLTFFCAFNLPIFQNASSSLPTFALKAQRGSKYHAARPVFAL